MSSKAELIEQAENLGIKVDGRWSEDRIKQALDMDSDVHFAYAFTPLGEPLTREQAIEYVNERSMAQWSGQSPMLPKHERKRRIIKAMKEKGFGGLIEEIKWPA